MTSSIIDGFISENTNDYSFTHWPIRKELRDYFVAEEEFVAYYKRVKGVCAIYRIGNVSQRGLSDLDFIVVMEDDYKHRFGLMYDLSPFSENSQGTPPSYRRQK